MEPLVRVENVRKTYQTGELTLDALCDVSLTIEEGDFLALVGPSGSGKTTLLNLIGALDSPSNGNIFLDGEPLTGHKEDQLAEMRLRKLGFVFQAYNLVPVLSAYENVEFQLILQGVEPEQRKTMVEEILAEMGLKDHMHKRPAEMSGGQQQRVAVARAIVSKPRLVLADEPTANLDSTTSQELLNLMRELNEKYGVTFIFSTHDPMVMETARRIVHLRDGQIVENAA